MIGTETGIGIVKKKETEKETEKKIETEIEKETKIRKDRKIAKRNHVHLHRLRIMELDIVAHL